MYFFDNITFYFLFLAERFIGVIVFLSLILVTCIGDLWEQGYVHKFLSDHFVLVLLDKCLFCLLLSTVHIYVIKFLQK